MWENEQLDISKFAIAEFAPGEGVVRERCFEIKTCQRTLILYRATSELKKFFTSIARRHFDGIEAYEYLLRFACGLESEIKGETDVFGQVKTAFKNLSSQNSDLAHSMKNISLRLFEDTKEIRSDHLQGIGGNTYGTLARRLLNPSAQDQVLIIGAGDMSKSISPYFAEFSLKIWNRGSDRLQTLGDELAKKGHNPTLSSSEKELTDSIAEASLIIIATPFGSSIDSHVEQHRAPSAKILHLGAQEHQVNTLTFDSLSLTDLFAMEKIQSDLRQKQVNQAIHACHERSLLRGLSRSIHVAHGWEDLAVFF